MDLDRDTSYEDEQTIAAQLLSKDLIQHTTVEAFASRCASIWDDWILFLSRTTIPPRITSRDSRFTHAFQTIERTISTTDGVLQWLAYIRLMQVFDTLKKAIGKERKIKIGQRKQGISDDSIAINIYQDALEGRLMRRHILERRRVSRRWALLSKPSPLFLLVYSNYAETIVNGFRGVNNPVLDLIGDQVAQRYSPQFTQLCIRLAKGAEEGAVSGSCNLQQLWDSIWHD
ncbi:uncharacterized protein P884DRAFT_111561 [Thermothelomyces heterothallicus CBS 202.75]|uniref:uncharacterized protein n=1 Tax=Thermothelomyces heterothallicus CBS 202.75 TaxID=1149848 RepID=UPI0037439707